MGGAQDPLVSSEPYQELIVKAVIGVLVMSSCGTTPDNGYLLALSKGRYVTDWSSLRRFDSSRICTNHYVDVFVFLSKKGGT